MDEKIVLSVEGMTCTSCAQGIARHLSKKGLKEVSVDYDAGKVEIGDNNNQPVDVIIEEINSLGYRAFYNKTEDSAAPFFTRERYFFIAAFFTLPLLLHMWIPLPVLHNSYVQLALSLPVMFIGYLHFGRSALGSLRHLQPNMDVLIMTGSSAAFLYSLSGLIIYGDLHDGQFQFFETAAAIITFLLLGNLIEHRTLKKTNTALKELSLLQPTVAHRIVNPMTEQESTETVDASHLKKNDLILVNTGDKIPADGLIYWGSATIDEAAMTGEPTPAEKSENNSVLAGTILLKGSIKIIAEATGESTVLNNVIRIVKNATHEKPAIQRMGDKVSAWFVPSVLVISLLTFLISFFTLDVSMSNSILRGVAVLVISCPCAMGLATPTAVAAGIGRAAKEGILIKNGRILETLSQSTVIVFDKTGTLTKKEIKIASEEYFTTKEDSLFLIHQLEKHSAHPVAMALLSLPKPDIGYMGPKFTSIEEEKGFGMKAIDKDGNRYFIGKTISSDQDLHKYQVIVTKNESVIAGFTIGEEVREGAASMVDYFKVNGFKTVLLSGDKDASCRRVAQQTGIEEVYSEKIPTEKHEVIQSLKKAGKVIMIGDGINDSPSLATADTGISFGSATQIAISSSDIILMNEDNLLQIKKAHQLAMSTMLTIKQNLFWALFYNIIAIPVAAGGWLSPVISSFSMAFSDVIVIGNSIRLKFKNIFTR